MWYILLISVFVASALTPALTVTSKGEEQKLMLILLDGFRWDYVEKYNLMNFKRFYATGVRAKSMVVEYPSLSFPNYYSIMTGLHVESHGMVGNTMYDRARDDSFYLDHTPEHLHPHWWEGAWPIWVSVEKQGKTCYTFHWRGPEVSIHGTHPTWYRPYQGIPTTPQFKTAIKEGLAVLSNGTADFVAIYYENSDHYGHVSGPDSPELVEILKSVDGILGDLLDSLQRPKQDEKINLMVVSDHGMTNIDRSRVINITSVLTSDLYINITEDSALCNIHLADPKQQEKVYKLLAHFHPRMTCYKREDIPNRLYYKQGSHVPLVVCAADLGWSILHPVKPTFFSNGETGADMKGTHGYDNSLMDMRGIFYATGPYFKAGSSVKSIRSVDLYNVMCGILGITPRPNNGTTQHMNPLLTSYSSAVSNLQAFDQIFAFVVAVNIMTLFRFLV